MVRHFKQEYKTDREELDAEKIAVKLEDAIANSNMGTWSVGRVNCHGLPDFQIGTVVLYFITHNELRNFGKKIMDVRVVSVPKTDLRTNFKKLHLELLNTCTTLSYDKIRR